MIPGSELRCGGGGGAALTLSDVRKVKDQDRITPIFPPIVFTEALLFNLQSSSDTVLMKFSHFSVPDSVLPSSSAHVSSAGMSWFLCGQIEMSELALEQNLWRRSNRSGKANELSECCHTRWQTAPDGLEGFSLRHTSVPTASTLPSSNPNTSTCAQYEPTWCLFQPFWF